MNDIPPLNTTEGVVQQYIIPSNQKLNNTIVKYKQQQHL
jgi:hypothetical protein